MRFTCSIEGLEANWIEFDDVWTRNEGQELLGDNNEAAIDKFIARKCTGCYIEQVDGPAQTDPQKLTWEWMGDIDVRVHRFVVRSLFASYTESMQLGNASARRSSNGVVPAMTTAPANQMH